jgi:hypothetical protein
MGYSLHADLHVSFRILSCCHRLAGQENADKEKGKGEAGIPDRMNPSGVLEFFHGERLQLCNFSMIFASWRLQMVLPIPSFSKRGF